MTIHPDAMTPIGTLSVDELTRARRIVAADPAAIWPAVRAALSIQDGEDTLDRMQRVIEEARCAT